MIQLKRIVTSLLAGVIVCSTILQQVLPVMAAPEEEKKEITQAMAVAEDISVEQGSIEFVSETLDKITFNSEIETVVLKEIKGAESQADFDIQQPDTYQAVYTVTNLQNQTSYEIMRKIIVTPKEPEQSEQTSSSQKDEESEQGEEAEPEPARQIAPESGLVLFGIDPNARASQNATLTVGHRIDYPSNLGRMYTSYFTVNGKIAYCLESAKATPPAGDYTGTILEGNPSLQKALYYGYGGAGDVTGTYMPQFDGDLKYVFTHIAASYFYCGMEGFAGCTIEDLRDCGVLGWINYLENLPAPPTPHLSISNPNLKATYDGSKQITDSIQLEGDSRNYITVNVPDNVTYHNRDNGQTQTGGTVSVLGGTNFYFTAPVTVNGVWNTGEMRGTIRNLWKALVVPTGGSSQDIGSYYEEETGNAVSFNVDWLERAKVEVIKVDYVSNAKLAGAIFGIYRDANCTDLITTMPATNNKGVSTAEIVMTQNKVYLKEITAPTGYRYNATAYEVLLEANQTTSTTVPDEEQFGNLTIYKEGEVLIGASSNAEGTTFQYEKRRQKGTIYNVYAKEDIKTAYGKVVYKAGDLVAEKIVTGENGAVTLQKLHLGTYRVTEVQAPENFHNPRESKTVTVAYAGQDAEAAFSDTTFQNERQKAEVKVVKKDKNTLQPLAGGIFGLYASEDIKNADGAVVVGNNSLLAKVTTDGKGTAVFATDLPIGFRFHVKELQAPVGYQRNLEEVYSFSFTYTNDEEAKVVFSHTFVNERVNCFITLLKKDMETNTNIPQGDATLEGAIYGLYARTDIVHPDQKTGVIYRAGQQVGTLTTDKRGNASIKNLYLGSYFVKEIAPPAGYLADETEYDLVCDYQGDLSATVEKSVTSLEQIKKQPFQIIKAANNGNTDAELLEGAGFTAYLQSSLTVKPDGSYDFEAATPVILGENGATEIFTDAKGHALSIPLPYGTYIVRETTTPHNYKPVDDFIVRITEHKPTEPQIWRVLLDDEFEAKLKIIKWDDETKKPVLAANTEFKIYDIKNKKYVEQVTTYPTVVTHKSYFTTADGYLILPQNLSIGEYRIEEVTAPDGYLIHKNYIKTKVDTDTLYQIDAVSGDAIIEVIYENHPVKGELQVVKKGEVLTGYKKDFIYEVEHLKGAVFEVYAAEDIYTADFQKDAEGNRIKEYTKDELVDTLTTDKEGKATVKNLPLGSYKVVEKTAPDGFTNNTKEQMVTLSYKNQDTPVVVEGTEFINERQKVEISVVKKDAENEKVLAGAEFGLYAKTDIKREETVIVKADTLLAREVTGEDGVARFKQDLPMGSYYLKELKAPLGYVSSGQVIDVNAAYQGQDIKVVRLQEIFQNKPTEFAFTKVDSTTGEELDGATLSVLDKMGKVVDTWVSVKGTAHVIKRLHVGESYTLREETAPYGYLKAEDVKFTVEDTEAVQKVEMKDVVPTGRLIINKKGEVLEHISLIDTVGGWIEHFFEYITGCNW